MARLKLRKIVLIMSILFALPVVSASGIPKAIGWLLSEQNPDGNWGDQTKGVEYQVYLTSSVLLALSDYIEYGPKNDTAEDITRIKAAIKESEIWLGMQAPRDTIGISAYIRAIGSGALYKRLLEEQNQDGGWGKSIGFQSTPWYTANALLALGAEHTKALEAGARYLLISQDEDGSWENTASATSLGLLALANVYSIKNDSGYVLAARKAETWLLSKQGADGSWFDASSTAGSVLALKAMYSYLNLASERMAADKGVFFLIANQKVDGSWGTSPSSRIFDDAYTTAEVFSSLSRGLQFKPIEPLLIIQANFSSQHVLGGDDVEIAVSVSNQGFLELNSVNITINLPLALGGRQETWSVKSLKPGKSVTRKHNLSVSRGSFGEQTVEVESTFTEANELERKYRKKALSVVKVHEVPVRLKLAPSQVTNGSRWNFTAILVNPGAEGVTLENTTVEIESDWGDVSLFENNGIYIKPKDETQVELFEAASPRKAGIYRVSLKLFTMHPSLGSRPFSFDEYVTVNSIESYSPMLMVPSGIYNVISAAILLFAAAFLINLIFGFDVIK